jgi:hypothetical protein
MEHEIRKHMHNIMAETTNRKRSVWKRLGEIMIEVIIIVFAVSFAVFMERQREHNHEQKEVKEFLLGLKTDLNSDIEEMKGDTTYGYNQQEKSLKYFARNTKLHPDSVKLNQGVLLSETHLLINNGRYEGFKASGKMNTIENKELRNHILDLYQEKLIGLTNITAKHLFIKREMNQRIMALRKNTGTQKDNLIAVMSNNEIRNYCISLSDTREIMRYYRLSIILSKKIVEFIDTEYPEQKAGIKK